MLPAANKILTVNPFAAEAAAQLSEGLVTLYANYWDAARSMPVFLLIGTPRVPGDAVGPQVGDFLKQHGFSGLYAGDSENPVNARNVIDQRDNLFGRTRTRYGKYPYLVAVDAAIGPDLHMVSLWDGPLAPASGADQFLPYMGKVHLKATTAETLPGLYHTPQTHVASMAQIIGSALLSFWDFWQKQYGGQNR